MHKNSLLNNDHKKTVLIRSLANKMARNKDELWGEF